MQASALRKNGHVVIAESPCKIVEMTISKNGKHGGCKVHLVAVDIFNGRKHETLVTSTQNVFVPTIEKCEYKLIDITDEEYVHVLEMNGNVKEDLRVPKGDLGMRLKASFENGTDIEIIVIKAMDGEQIISYKESSIA